MTISQQPWSLRLAAHQANEERPSASLLDREGNLIAIFSDARNAEYAVQQHECIQELEEEINNLKCLNEELEEEINKLNGLNDHLKNQSLSHGTR